MKTLKTYTLLLLVLLAFSCKKDDDGGAPQQAYFPVNITNTSTGTSLNITYNNNNQISNLSFSDGTTVSAMVYNQNDQLTQLMLNGTPYQFSYEANGNLDNIIINGATPIPVNFNTPNSTFSVGEFEFEIFVTLNSNNNFLRSEAPIGTTRMEATYGTASGIFSNYDVPVALTILFIVFEDTPEYLLITNLFSKTEVNHVTSPDFMAPSYVFENYVRDENNLITSYTINFAGEVDNNTVTYQQRTIN